VVWHLKGRTPERLNRPRAAPESERTPFARAVGDQPRAGPDLDAVRLFGLR
jgi:hypothetical protein